jgi:hypothetical protein
MVSQVFDYERDKGLMKHLSQVIKKRL